MSDYQAVKHLLSQLFSHDNQELDIAGISDHLVSQFEDVGSTVKSDGEEGDPLAFIGVLPWHLVSIILRRRSPQNKLGSTPRISLM